MQENFPKALKSILDSEGFYDGKKGEMNDAADSGGFTIAGMTVGNYCEYYGLPKVADPHNPPEEIKASMRRMTEEHLGPYYKAHKWDDIRGDELPPGVDLAVADVCVLHGPGKGRQFFRRALGLGESMGKLSDDDIRAAWADTVNWDVLIEAIAAARRDHYERIIAAYPAKSKWRKGWFNRTARVTAECCALAPDRGGDVGLLTDHGRADHDEA